MATCLTGVYITAKEPTVPDYNAMPLGNLIDLLAQKMQLFTHSLNREEYEECKQAIKQIQLAIEQKQANGGKDESSPLKKDTSPES